MSPQQEILLNEEALFARMATGDQAAFTKIFYYYTPRIYGFILSKTKSEELTEEIVQETFIKLWNKRAELPEIYNFESYLFTMAANKAYDFLRKMANDEKLKRQVFQYMQDYSNITAEALDLKQSQELVNEAIELLSPQRKKIFLLSREHGLSHAEIAEQLNLSPSTVNNHLTEALRLIKAHLQKTPGTSLTLVMILMRINL